MELLIVLFLALVIVCGAIGCFWQSVKWVINCSRKAKGLKPIKSLF
jgi:Tfp pilus assembly protein PilW